MSDSNIHTEPVIPEYLLKDQLGKAIAARVEPGQVIGIGTGSTVDFAIWAIGERIRTEGLQIAALVTSPQSALACQEQGIPVINSIAYSPPLDWAFDGADEVDADRRLIKGRGGAMLMEKIIAARAKKFIVIADEKKFVEKLCQTCPVPVEVIPEALSYVAWALEQKGAIQLSLRNGAPGKHGPVVTDKGNFILDALFKDIPAGFEQELKCIVGVVETGLFLTQASEVLLGTQSGIRTL